MTLNLSTGIGCRVDASPLSGMNVPLKALLPSIPYSRIVRLMMERTDAKTRSVWLYNDLGQALAFSMHKNAVRGVTGAVTESEASVCLALLVQGK